MFVQFVSKHIKVLGEGGKERVGPIGRFAQPLLNPLGLEQYALVALQTSGSAAITGAANHPQRVSRLVLRRAYARGPDYFGSSLLRGDACAPARGLGTLHGDNRQRPHGATEAFIPPALILTSTSSVPQGAVPNTGPPPPSAPFASGRCREGSCRRARATRRECGGAWQ